MSDDTIVVTKQPILNNTSSLSDIDVTSNTRTDPVVVSTSSETDTNQRNTLMDTTSFAIKGMNAWTIGRYLLIILILAFLGFNVFTTLGNITDNTHGILAPLLSSLGFGVGETIKQTVNTSAKGTKTGVDVVAGTVDNATTFLEKSVGVKGVKFNRLDKKSVSTEKAIQAATKNQKSQKNIPEADDATSSTQQFKKGKSGYCYIGEDRGFRSCIKVGEGDNCISGDIFPSKELCINPNLRE